MNPSLFTYSEENGAQRNVCHKYSRAEVLHLAKAKKEEGGDWVPFLQGKQKGRERSRKKVVI